MTQKVYKYKRKNKVISGYKRRVRSPFMRMLYKLYAIGRATVYIAGIAFFGLILYAATR